MFSLVVNILPYVQGVSSVLFKKVKKIFNKIKIMLTKTKKEGIIRKI